MVLLCLKLKKTTTYRGLVGELIEMAPIRDVLELDQIPAPSTLSKTFNRLKMAVWWVLLNVSLAGLPLSGITGIDASGLERANLTIQHLKTTLLVDTATNAVLDIHMMTTRTHDTQIGPQVLTRNTEVIDIFVGDNGYDDQSLRPFARENNVRPLLKHQEFTPLHEAWNA